MKILSLYNRQSHQTSSPVQFGKVDHNVELTTDRDIFVPTKPKVATAVHFGTTSTITEYVPGPLSLYEINRAVKAAKAGIPMPDYFKLMIPEFEEILELAEEAGQHIYIQNEPPENTVQRRGVLGVLYEDGFVPGRLGYSAMKCLGDAYNLGIQIPDHLKWLAQYCLPISDVLNRALDTELANGIFFSNGLELMKPTIQDLPALLQFIEDVDAADNMPPEYFERLKAYITADLKRSQHQGQYLLVRGIGNQKIVGLIACHLFSPREGLENITLEGGKIVELNALYVHPDLQGHHQKLDCGVQVTGQRMQKSLATALYEAMEEYLCFRGYDKIMLETSDQHERAWRFYEKMGFQRVGVTEDEHENQFYVYVKDLSPLDPEN